jgi:hypothetical protein
VARKFSFFLSPFFVILFNIEIKKKVERESFLCERENKSLGFPPKTPAGFLIFSFERKIPKGKKGLGV